MRSLIIKASTHPLWSINFVCTPCTNFGISKPLWILTFDFILSVWLLVARNQNGGSVKLLVTNNGSCYNYIAVPFEFWRGRINLSFLISLTLFSTHTLLKGFEGFSAVAVSSRTTLCWSCSQLLPCAQELPDAHAAPLARHELLAGLRCWMPLADLPGFPGSRLQVGFRY